MPRIWEDSLIHLVWGKKNILDAKKRDEEWHAGEAKQNAVVKARREESARVVDKNEIAHQIGRDYGEGR
jgi:hypothetical protein